MGSRSGIARLLCVLLGWNIVHQDEGDTLENSCCQERPNLLQGCGGDGSVEERGQDDADEHGKGKVLQPGCKELEAFLPVLGVLGEQPWNTHGVGFL